MRKLHLQPATSMNIGYDGKRAFQNKTGLGNYSRSLVSALSQYYPQHQYTLFAPKQTDLFYTESNGNIQVITPTSFWGRRFPSWWRRKGLVGDVVNSKIDIYHGLSNELPAGLRHKPVKTVVTVHDLIFERFPETYNLDERYAHRWKVKHACQTADAVIAISRQTKEDLVQFYKISPDKITVCYQTCHPVFQQPVNEAEKTEIKKKYALPDNYFLFVSSVTPRKNLVTVCKALLLLKEKINIPLVVIGDGKKEKEAVKKFMREHGMTEQLLFLNEMPEAKSPGFISGNDFPCIYRQAIALIYPSVFEGFGLPVLEALFSGLPVICSNTSSLPEAGGEAALYFSPMDHEALAAYMMQVVMDTHLVSSLKEKGGQHVRAFTPARHAQSVMEVYQRLV